MTRNEAAERLRSLIGRWTSPATTRSLQASLDEALAAERRATVERIVDAIPTMEWINLPDAIIDPFRAEGWPFDGAA